MTNMNSRKKECLPQSTDCSVNVKIGTVAFSKSPGKIEWLMGLLLVQFVIVISMFELQQFRFFSIADRLEDAVTASGLASAIIDAERFEEEGVLEINDVYNAFYIYRQALTENGGNELTNVSVEHFVIYNVEEDEVEVISFDECGVPEVTRGKLGAVRAPNGVVIGSTGVYSEISCVVEGLYGTAVTAVRSKLIELHENDGVISTAIF